MNRRSPSFARAAEVPSRPDKSLWGNIPRPYPTNKWWTPACLEGGGWTIHPLPYQLQLRADVIAVCFPEYLSDEKYVCSIFVDNFRLSCKETVVGHRVVEFDDLSATFEWSTASEATCMRCPVVQGCPYVTVFYRDATPLLTSVFAISADFHGVYTGIIFKVPLNNGQVWMIYASKQITLNFNVNPMVIMGTEKFTGVIRIALLPNDPEAAKLLDHCRHMIATGGTANTQIDSNTLTYSYAFRTQRIAPLADKGELLMMALPHHVHMKVPMALAASIPWYRSIKGPMTGVLGTTWEMTLEVAPIGWNSLTRIDPKRAEIVRGSLLAESTIEVHNTDPYAFAKRLAAMGRLAIIGDELEEDVVARNIRRRMKLAFEPWLRGKNKNAIVYDSVWGGLISSEGARNPGADYGSGMYNDHHFQYGYFIYAAAAIGKKDAEWLDENKAPLADLIRDYVNPYDDDAYFPRMRHFDHYACHSWASGLFCFADGKNQESSSEAVNAYYAAALLGSVLENSALIRLGLSLSHLEILATQFYWHISDPDHSIYPQPFAQNGTVGIVWNGKVDYGTWFGSNIEYIHCIQMLPFLPISELLFSKPWVERVLDRIGHLRFDPDVEVSWRGFLWMVLAVVDREAAWRGFTQLDGKPDLGSSVTNALYFIATRP